MFRYKNLDKLVFDASVDADEFVIITGYIGPGVIKELKGLPYKTKIFVGMYENNIPDVIHSSLIKYDQYENIEIYYTKTPIHAKCYIWLKNRIIKQALIGSANFSTSGLYTPEREVLGDLVFSDFGEQYKYLEIVEKKAYSVHDPKHSIFASHFHFTTGTGGSVKQTESISLSLLASKSANTKNIVGVTTKAGEVHSSAGLNWGFSNGLPRPNDAYITIRSDHVKKHPLLFPQKSEKENLPIDVIWDDGKEMQLLLEGNQYLDDGIIYPKQISTYKNKSEIGLYLRKRIGEKLGIDLLLPEMMSKEYFKIVAMGYKDKLITREMLEKYGRTTIDVKLIGDRTYFFDFSTDKK